MYHKSFEYLLSNDPEKVVSEKGIRNRKIINPLFNFALRLLNPYKLKIEEKAEIPKDEPTIFVPSHGFRDDILNSLLTVNGPVYVLFGVIDQFFKTFDGIKLWLCGVFLVKRDDKISRAASKPKMVRALNLGANIMDFFEGTWNLSPNKLVEKIHIGIYDVAEESKEKVSDITTHIELRKIFRSICHSILGKRFDITKLTFQKASDTLRLITMNLSKIEDLLIYNDKNSIILREEVGKLKQLLNDGMDSSLIFSIKYLELLINNISDETSILINKIETEINNDRENDFYFDEDSIELDIIKRCINLLKATANSKKIVAVNELRNKIATNKYKLMKKYSNYSNIPRSRLEIWNTLEDQWEKYKKKLVKQVKYYNLEKEQSYIYKDPTEYNEDEVFACMDNFLENCSVTLNNLNVWKKTRNQTTSKVKLTRTELLKWRLSNLKRELLNRQSVKNQTNNDSLKDQAIENQNDVDNPLTLKKIK